MGGQPRPSDAFLVGPHPDEVLSSAPATPATPAGDGSTVGSPSASTLGGSRARPISACVTMPMRGGVGEGSSDGSLTRPSTPGLRDARVPYRLRIQSARAASSGRGAGESMTVPASPSIASRYNVPNKHMRVYFPKCVCLYRSRRRPKRRGARRSASIRLPVAGAVDARRHIRGRETKRSTDSIPTLGSCAAGRRPCPCLGTWI